MKIRSSPPHFTRPRAKACPSAPSIRPISFRGREVQIRHDEKIYRLQVTRNGKLILIK